MRRGIFALLVTFAVTLTEQAHAADLRYFDDAALRAVHFVDQKEGWAVGDEGVIWHTIDGGQSWERQATGVRASLRSVVFLSPYLGWAAGREELPHGRGSVGVLLFTDDGGLSWKRILSNTFPGLNQVKFVSEKTGFVFGDGADQYASGVFKTTDGGRTWAPVPGPRATSWLAGDFADANTALLGGAWSRLATMRQEQFSAAEAETLGGRAIRGLHILPRRAVAVGQGGVVMTSVSAGSKWGFPDLKLPTEVLANVDFNAIHAVGGQAWAVGRPGTALLHTDDSGVTWKLKKTGQPLPLHGVYFLDEKRGWAVGELGTIVSTTDGGETWKTQRQGGKRAAACFVHAGSDDLPYDALAHLGANEGYLVTTLRLSAPDPASAALPRAAEPQRLAAATRLAGGAGAELLWQFPLPMHLAQAEPKQLLEYWDQMHAQQAGKEVLRQLVLGLRIWRPEVVVAGQPSSANPGSALLIEALSEAVKLAGDAKSFPEQVEQLGLSPWRVKKLYCLWNKNEGGAAHDNHAPQPRLEASVKDFAAVAADLFGDAAAAVPPQRHYRLLYSAVEGADNQKHLMHGIAMAVGDTRRHIDAEQNDNPEIRKQILARRNLLVLAENLTDPSQTLAQIAPALAGLSDDQGAKAAFAIGNQYARKGQWLMAREAFLLMVDRYPAHPLAADAYRWLVRHISSSEARRRHELGQFLMVSNVAFAQHFEGPKHYEKSKEIQKVGAVNQTRDGRLTYLSSRDETRHWFKGSLEIGNRLAAFGPLYASDPSIQFCLQSSRRQLGEFAAAEEWYKRFQMFGPKGPWHDAASAELWLSNRGLPPPRRVGLCRLASQKPYLDGKFDDACWQGLQPMMLENAAGDTVKDYVTKAWFTYDNEFLYVALRCQHPAGKHVPPVKNRSRDAHLEAQDRVGIMLDLDRDYSTYFHFQVDQRGCVREDCWGDSTWNPKWFVAVHSTQDAWQIEAAIPLGEMSADRVAVNSAWAVNVVRVLPGRGVQAWSLPADAQPRPEGMALMLFQQQPNRPAAEAMPKAGP
ncbi:MAG: YCF48-related protein [Gemmataceae bacterium]|nr:YCF48-related protein [Gemmataceae bacterium]MCI0740870.1 YCF48-related protein [Gemmataceae bacterium]